MGGSVSLPAARALVKKITLDIFSKCAIIELQKGEMKNVLQKV